MKAVVIACAVAVLLLSATGVWAQQDLTGEWDVTSDVFLPPESTGQTTGNGDCLYEGTGDLIQSGNELGGTLLLDLQTGDPQLCPGALEGDISGTVNDGVNGQITTPFQEVLEFSGQFDGPDSLSGNFLVTAGDFLDYSGTWGAVPGAPVPALKATPLVLLLLVLLAVATLALRRRQAA